MGKLRDKRPVPLLLLVSIVIVGSAVTSRAALDTEFFFHKARVFLSEGKYLEAMGLYQTVADTAEGAEEKAQALLMIGVSYAFYLDQPARALQYFDYVLQTYPSAPAAAEAMFRKGVVFYKSGNYPDAYWIFTDYLTAYPEGRNVRSAKVWAESAMNLANVMPPGHSPRRPSLQYSSHTRIRVLLAEDQKELWISSGGGLDIGDCPAGRGKPVVGTRALFSASGESLAVNGCDLRRSCCCVRPRRGYLRLNGTRYRGSFIVSVRGERLSVINQVPLEEYLYGVVPREMPCAWPGEALKAQAVAARTYALYMKRCRGENFYDVAATTASQVYGGYDAENARTTAAVDETCGEIMTYGGDLVVAYFHANSGGYTESPKHVWGAEVPYLKAQPDRFSLGTSGSTWMYFLPYDEAGRRLQDYGFQTARVKRIQFQEKTPSGRFCKVRVISDKGTRTINSNQFRLAIGSTKLKSTCFQATPQEAGVLFTGQGYGHGVGMSQWGARRMALAGHDYKNILRHYYADIKIASVVQ